MDDESGLFKISCEKHSSGRFWEHFVAGAVAGAVSRTLTAPLDRLKTFKQVGSRDSSVYKIANEMFKEGGVIGLWRGNWLNVLKNTPKQAIRFAVYDTCKKLFLTDDGCGHLTMGQRFFAGCAAGGVSHVAVYPLEMLKVRLSLRTTGRYKGILDAIRKIYRTEGLKSFGRGFVPSVISIIPMSGLDLMCYETMKGMLANKYNRLANPFEQFVIGSIAGLIAQIVTYPLALICVKMQADERDPLKHKIIMRRLLVDIWKKDGISGMYRGMFVYLFKFLPTVGITYVAYEKVTHYFSKTL